MPKEYNTMKSAEIATEHNYIMIDSIRNYQLSVPPMESAKEMDNVKELPHLPVHHGG